MLYSQVEGSLSKIFIVDISIQGDKFLEHLGPPALGTELERRPPRPIGYVDINLILELGHQCLKQFLIVLIDSQVKDRGHLLRLDVWVGSSL